MPRYIIRKYVEAKSLVEALQNESKVRPEDGWLDEKQPEQGATGIGFDLSTDRISYSPILKRKKKRK